MGKSKKMPNIDFGMLDETTIHIKDNQGASVENPKARGKNNVFGSGVNAF